MSRTVSQPARVPGSRRTAVALSPRAQAWLDAPANRSDVDVTRRLACGVTKMAIEKMRFGGAARAETVATVEAAIMRLLDGAP